MKTERKKLFLLLIPRVKPIRKYSCAPIVYGEKYRQPSMSPLIKKLAAPSPR
jgi:hypothetical protein